MNTIQGTLRHFLVEDTQHGVLVSFKLHGDASIHKGTFLNEDNKMLQLLQRSGPGDDVEITTDDEGALCEVTWKNNSCPMNLKLKQPKVGDFDGMMYFNPDESLVFAKKVHVRYN
jgi:hypothetical protein